MAVPEHVAQTEEHSESAISALISVVPPLSACATALLSGVNISKKNDLVSPVEEGLVKIPLSTPNCPGLVILGNSPSTVIVVFPLESVPTVHVRLTEESNKFAQVFKDVEPPVFVSEIVTPSGKVITRIEF